MIVSRLIGGLGNQMFQYAAGRALALERNEDFFVDIFDFKNYTLHNGYELDKPFESMPLIADGNLLKRNLGWQFSPLLRKLRLHPSFSKFTRNNIQEPHFQYWNGLKSTPSPCYISGYWQSEKYFSDFAPTIRSDFRFRPFSSSLNRDLAAKISSVTAVGVHIRRGDYASNPKTTSTHGLCTLEYYRSAIEKISTSVANPYFFFFSDDIPWVRESLSIGDHPHAFISNNQGLASYNDMHLMSLCKHNIIANSSFSWWGAWLNANPSKIVCAPRSWFAAPHMKTDDLIPSTWHRL
jgi:hypothetical protein